MADRPPIAWREAVPTSQRFMNEGPRCNGCAGCAVSVHDSDGWCRLCCVYCNGEFY